MTSATTFTKRPGWHQQTLLPPTPSIHNVDFRKNQEVRKKKDTQNNFTVRNGCRPTLCGGSLHKIMAAAPSADEVEDKFKRTHGPKYTRCNSGFHRVWCIKKHVSQCRFSIWATVLLTFRKKLSLDSGQIGKGCLCRNHRQLPLARQSQLAAKLLHFIFLVSKSRELFRD